MKESFWRNTENPNNCVIFSDLFKGFDISHHLISIEFFRFMTTEVKISSVCGWAAFAQNIRLPSLCFDIAMSMSISYSVNRTKIPTVNQRQCNVGKCVSWCNCWSWFLNAEIIQRKHNTFWDDIMQQFHLFQCCAVRLTLYEYVFVKPSKCFFFLSWCKATNFRGPSGNAKWVVVVPPRFRYRCK